MSMEPNSVAYIFTSNKWSDWLAHKYLAAERRSSRSLNSAWAVGERYWTYKRPPPGLSREQMIAVTTYTVGQPRFYAEFNEEIRSWGKDLRTYNICFRFKSFHYLLSTALVKLRNLQANLIRPQLYRGLGIALTANQNHEVRFGRYTSTSANKAKAEKFGKGTLFDLRSSLAVSISQWSVFPNEKEWLIPPHEVFKVRRFRRNWNRSKITLQLSRSRATKLVLHVCKLVFF
uniref:NAD(P)(+)--arginine ADP-ribosyltransferase n=1 Tax=Callorhinchus milii TaxID=7868 RepID=A0A4W3GDH7_CALMI